MNNAASDWNTFLTKASAPSDVYLRAAPLAALFNPPASPARCRADRGDRGITLPAKCAIDDWSDSAPHQVPSLSVNGTASTSMPISNSCSIVAYPWRRTGRFSPSATQYRSPYRGYVVPGLCAAGRSHTLLPAAKPATVAPGGTENGHPLPKPHRRRVERRMPTAGDIDQFIFIHHPHRGVLFGPAGDVFDNRPYHARKLRRIDISLAKPQRLWGKPVIAPVGLQIALMQERQQKRRAALCVRPLIFAVWATVSFGQVLEKS